MSGHKLVGYRGWALGEEGVARAWVEEGYVPTLAECMTGAYVVIAISYARSGEITRFQARAIRRLYPGAQVFGRRDYGGRLRPLRVRNTQADMS